MSVNVVKAQFFYGKAPSDGSKPYEHVNADSVTGERKRNFEVVPYEVDVENVRGKEDDYSLDTSGFAFVKAPAKHKGFTNNEDIQKEYYPESVELLKNLTGASRVVLFDHTVRRFRLGQIDDSPQRRQPATRVHVDQTTASAVARVHRHLPGSDVGTLLKRRFQIINLWRPIGHAAFDHPLALCDYRSVDVKNDLVPTTLKYPDRDGETFSVMYNPKQRWKYLKGMEPDEIVLIKCYDSIEDGSVAVLTPHTAFVDPSAPADALPRESIELRALVFYD